MLRKVSGNPLTSEITGMVSWQNTFEMGVSARSNSSFSLLSFINISGIQLGYAYETPRSNQLAGLGLKTHELILRFQFGESETTPVEGENLPTDE
ncbi:MAG: type IX secretion system membrane protein PorP/SprF, partial [Flavobacteriaceae bacterium]